MSTKTILTTVPSNINMLKLNALQSLFAEVTGETTRSPNRKFLIRKITEQIEANADAEAMVDATMEAHQETTAIEPEAQPEPIESIMEEDDPFLSRVGPETEDENPLVSHESPYEPLEGEAGELSTQNVRNPGTSAILEPPLTAASTNEPQADEPAPQATATKPPHGRFSNMTVEQLQALYLTTVGRPTGSDNKAYLIWKIREAEKGRITVGAITREPKAEGDTADMKILPLRLETKVVETMDAAWKERGIKNRMEFFRQALGHYLTHLGATEAAALFTTTKAE